MIGNGSLVSHLSFSNERNQFALFDFIYQREDPHPQIFSNLIGWMNRTFFVGLEGFSQFYPLFIPEMLQLKQGHHFILSMLISSACRFKFLFLSKTFWFSFISITMYIVQNDSERCLMMQNGLIRASNVVRWQILKLAMIVISSSEIPFWLTKFILFLRKKTG